MPSSTRWLSMSPPARAGCHVKPSGTPCRATDVPTVGRSAGPRSGHGYAAWALSRYCLARWTSSRTSLGSRLRNSGSSIHRRAGVKRNSRVRVTCVPTAVGVHSKLASKCAVACARQLYGGGDREMSMRTPGVRRACWTTLGWGSPAHWDRPGRAARSVRQEVWRIQAVVATRGIRIPRILLWDGEDRHELRNPVPTGFALTP